MKTDDTIDKTKDLYFLTTQSEKEKYNLLIAKVNRIMEERGVSLWDAIFSTNLTVTENTKIPYSQFKYIINTLNLGLSLKEKVMIRRICDPKNTG